MVPDNVSAYANKTVQLSQSRNQIETFIINSETIKTKVLLELTKNQLLELADAMGLELNRSLTKPIIIGRIIEMYNQDSTKTKLQHESLTYKQKVETTSSSISTSDLAYGETDLADPLNIVAVDADTEELPNQYFESKIVLLVRDPNCAFAYWDTNKKDRETLGANLRMRLYDITDGMSGSIDFSVLEHQEHPVPYVGSWYFHGLVPNRSYQAVLGYYLGSRFEIIAQSNQVFLPRDSVSDITHDDWNLPDNWNDIFKQSGGTLEKVFDLETFAGASMFNLRYNLSSGGLSSSYKPPIYSNTYDDPTKDSQ